MVNRLLVWAGENSRLERVANTNSLVAKMVHHYVAGPALDDGVAAAVELNGQGFARFSTCSARPSPTSTVPVRRRSSISRQSRPSPIAGSTQPSARQPAVLPAGREGNPPSCRQPTTGTPTCVKTRTLGSTRD
jgi:hypothetical protein